MKRRRPAPQLLASGGKMYPPSTTSYVMYRYSPARTRAQGPELRFVAETAPENFDHRGRADGGRQQREHAQCQNDQQPHAKLLLQKAGRAAKPGRPSPRFVGRPAPAVSLVPLLQQGPPESTRKNDSMSASVPTSPSLLKSAVFGHGGGGAVAREAREERRDVRVGADIAVAVEVRGARAVAGRRGVDLDRPTEQETIIGRIRVGHRQRPGSRGRLTDERANELGKFSAPLGAYRPAGSL